jgi:hypothetical protein
VPTPRRCFESATNAPASRRFFTMRGARVVRGSWAATRQIGYSIAQFRVAQNTARGAPDGDTRPGGDSVRLTWTTSRGAVLHIALPQPASRQDRSDPARVHWIGSGGGRVSAGGRSAYTTGRWPGSPRSTRRSTVMGWAMRNGCSTTRGATAGHGAEPPPVDDGGCPRSGRRSRSLPSASKATAEPPGLRRSSTLGGARRRLHRCATGLLSDDQLGHDCAGPSRALDHPGPGGRTTKRRDRRSPIDSSVPAVCSGSRLGTALARRLAIRG